MANWSEAPQTMPTTLMPPGSGGASPPTSAPTNAPSTSDWNGSRRPSALYWYVRCSSTCASVEPGACDGCGTAVTTGAPAPSPDAARAVAPGRAADGASAFTVAAPCGAVAAGLSEGFAGDADACDGCAVAGAGAVTA